jgi:hypothetical protein
VLNYPPQAWELWTNANEANDAITRKPHFLNGSQMNYIKEAGPKENWPKGQGCIREP